MDNTTNESKSGPGNIGSEHEWIATGNYNVQQRFFLARLERMLNLRTSLPPNTEPWRVALLNRAIYSTYRDCQALSLSREAHLLLHGTKKEKSSSTA